MGTDELLRAIAAWVAAHYPGEQGERVTIHLRTGRRVPLPLPQVLPMVVTSARKADQDEGGRLHQLERDILAVLDEAGKPLKRDSVVRALGAAGHDWGDSTVWRRLARMVREGLVWRADDGYTSIPPEE